MHSSTTMVMLAKSTYKYIFKKKDTCQYKKEKKRRQNIHYLVHKFVIKLLMSS